MEERSIRVLLIEDNPGDTGLIREMLAEASGRQFNLECFDHLSDGLKYLTRNNVDIVLLDLELPDSQGLDTLFMVRTQIELPVVLLTGLDDEAIGEEAVRVGAQDYLVKGQVTSGLLARTLFHSLERFRMQKKVEQYALEAKRAERRLRMVIQKNAAGIVIVNKDGIVRFVNPAAEYIINHKAQELLGKPLGFAMTEAGETTEIEIARSDTQKVVAEMSIAKIEWGNETAYLISLHDVTKYKQLIQHQSKYNSHSKATA